MLGGADLLPDGANHSPASEINESSPKHSLKKSARRELLSGFALGRLAAAAEKAKGEEGGEGGENGEGAEGEPADIEGLLGYSSASGFSEDSASKSDAGELSTWYTTLLPASYMHLHLHMHMVSRLAHVRARVYLPLTHLRTQATRI